LSIAASLAAEGTTRPDRWSHTPFSRPPDRGCGNFGSTTPRPCTDALSATAARAQQLPTDEQRAACQADYARFCSDVVPGGGRIIACLTRNYAQLADACKKVLDAANAKNN
jgi:hypothetical protein